MKASTRKMIEQFKRMNSGKTPAARYDLACWLRDNGIYLWAIRNR